MRTTNMKYTLNKGPYQSKIEVICLSVLFILALTLLVLVSIQNWELIRSTLDFTVSFFKQGFESMLR